MLQTVVPTREGFHTLTPYLIMDDAAAAIEFYKEIFGATELVRITQSDGWIQHAEIKIGDSIVMLVGANPKFPEMQSIKSAGSSPIHLYLYVLDVDVMVDRVLAAGGKLIGKIIDAAQGDRRGGVEDPFGLVWWL